MDSKENETKEIPITSEMNELVHFKTKKAEQVKGWYLAIMKAAHQEGAYLFLKRIGQCFFFLAGLALLVVK